MEQGTLTIFLIEGDLTRDTELWGQMDPYAKFTYEGNVKQSAVMDNAGKKPKW